MGLSRGTGTSYAYITEYTAFIENITKVPCKESGTESKGVMAVETLVRFRQSKQRGYEDRTDAITRARREDTRLCR